VPDCLVGSRHFEPARASQKEANGSKIQEKTRRDAHRDSFLCGVSTRSIRYEMQLDNVTQVTLGKAEKSSSKRETAPCEKESR